MSEAATATAPDDDLSIPLSALQHYLYCPRQCALIHLERIWTESAHTAEGRVLHARVDQVHASRHRGKRVVSAMPLAHDELGIHGVADVVEFDDGTDPPSVMPVEYKRGRPKSHRADEVQLCAQAMCLESMLGISIVAGALFYGERRRRTDVPFDGTLRALTLQSIADVRRMLESRRTPSATYDRRRCDACSLLEDCRPRMLTRGRNVQQWLRRQLETTAAPDEDGEHDTPCASS